MAYTDWKSPGTCANVDRDVKSSWANPTNAATSNDVRAICNVGTATHGDWLRLTKFGFTSPTDIPTNQVITGIKVSVERQAETNGSIYDSAIFLRKTSGQVGVNKATGLSWLAGTDVSIIYGSSSDLWETTWTIAEIISDDFGIDISAFNIATSAAKEARIDHVKIQIYYGFPKLQMMI